MHKGIASTSVILIKIDNPSALGDLRPISLCNFSSKILSKIIATRIAAFLPMLISNNLLSFVDEISRRTLRWLRNWYNGLPIRFVGGT